MCDYRHPLPECVYDVHMGYWKVVSLLSELLEGNRPAAGVNKFRAKLANFHPKLDNLNVKVVSNSA